MYIYFKSVHPTAYNFIAKEICCKYMSNSRSINICLWDKIKQLGMALPEREAQEKRRLFCVG